MPNTIRRPPGVQHLTVNTTRVGETGTDSPMIQSPSFFLTQGVASPRLRTFNLSENNPSVQMEGEIIRKANETKLKRYWYTLLGRELYVYKNK